MLEYTKAAACKCNANVTSFLECPFKILYAVYTMYLFRTRSEPGPVQVSRRTHLAHSKILELSNLARYIT